MRTGQIHYLMVLLLAAVLTACSNTENMRTGNLPPTITSQPADQTVAEGEAATFSVVASGTAPLSYQWRKGVMEISGAISSSYTTPPTTAADDGATFDVIVSNAAGSAISDTATLTVNTSTPTASTLSIAFDVKQLQFSWSEATGASFYRLLLSPDGVSAFAQVGDDIAAPATSITRDIAVYAQDWAAARYALDACNTVGCTRSNEVTISAGMLAAIGYFKASNAGAGDAFGISVAVSGDGNTLAVGAIAESSAATGVGGNQADDSAGSSGAVYVFTRSGGMWSQQAYVKASNTDAFDGFGFSVAVSGDGNTLAVGAIGESGAATGVGGNQADNSASGAGAVYAFTCSTGVWSQQAYVKASNTDLFDEFGFSVAVSGDGNTLVVGAAEEDSAATGIGGNQTDNSAGGAGAVYVFMRSSGVWSQQAYIKASNTDALDGFGGFSVALSRDGGTLAVGAIAESSSATSIGGDQTDNSASGAGAVYLY
jgi:hypothetical protein